MMAGPGWLVAGNKININKIYYRNKVKKFIIQPTEKSRKKKRIKW